MKSEESMVVYKIIQKNPRIKASEIAKMLQKRRSVITYHVQKLIQADVIEAKKVGRAKQLSVKMEITPQFDSIS